MVDCLIAFGANEGEPEANFRQAIELLRATDGIEVTAVGEPVQTEPVGGPKDQPSCLLYTSPSPRDLSTSRMPSSA